MLLIYSILATVGIYFWLKGTGRIKNTNPDYIPSLGIFKVCGAIMAITGLFLVIVAVNKLF